MFVGTLTVGDGRLFYDLFAMHFPASDAFKPWQVVTHMFMHGGFTHLLFNMFALWMFGTPVEQRLGRNKFLFIYFSAGIGAVLFQLAGYYWDYFPAVTNLMESGLSKTAINDIINFNILDGNQFTGKLLTEQLEPYLYENGIPESIINQSVYNNLFETNVLIHNSTMVGASGCIMGILAAFGLMNPNAELMMILLPIPIKAKYFIPGIIILDVISAFTGQSFFSPSNTAYLAHVGGAIIGFIVMWYWKKNSMNKYRWDQ
ncbi:rhomboid family protein [Olleya aquimaris]|uniref:Rhomboid family protein n=2 Tax=Olleya aquimaris TaxID=639310 RepID=A0A327RKV2_9FLAO|nr:rhomboid family protein [Olleya aquimaris]